MRRLSRISEDMVGLREPSGSRQVATAPGARSGRRPCATHPKWTLPPPPPAGVGREVVPPMSPEKLNSPE